MEKLTSERLAQITRALQSATPRELRDHASPRSRIALRRAPGLEHADWFEGHNPLHPGELPEGQWHEWVALAEKILGITREEVFMLVAAARVTDPKGPPFLAALRKRREKK